MNREEYQKKYEAQLKELDLVGYYKIGSGHDLRYFKSFHTAEMLDFYHLGRITYGFFYNPDTKDAVGAWETDWDREGLDDFINEVVNSIYSGDYPEDIMEDYKKECEKRKEEYLLNENKKNLEYRLKFGLCNIGDTIEIIKGRKLPIGEIKVIEKLEPYYKNGIQCCTYAYFTDGTRTNIKNCKLIKQASLEFIMEYARTH